MDNYVHVWIEKQKPASAGEPRVFGGRSLYWVFRTQYRVRSQLPRRPARSFAIRPSTIGAGMPVAAGMQQPSRFEFLNRTPHDRRFWSEIQALQCSQETHNVVCRKDL